MTLKISLTPLDNLFSQYIRARDKVCQRCGGNHGLQCSHFWGRRRKSTRYDDDNCCALCFGCHLYFHSNPQEYREFMIKRLGSEEKYDWLMKRAQTPQKPDINGIYLYIKSKIGELEG